jgi:hypothetical protein
MTAKTPRSANGTAKPAGLARPVASIEEAMDLRDRLVSEMCAAGTGSPASSALLTEVAEALRLAGRLRAEAEADLFTKSARSGRSYLHPGIPAAGEDIRRA